MKMEHHFICQTCAILHGAKNIPDHICTAHVDVCPYCGDEETLTGLNDYLWSKNKKLDKQSKQNWD